MSTSGLFYHRAVPRLATPSRVETDLCVYGATSAGLVAAIQARRSGHRVAVVEMGRRLGGLTAGGLGATDIGNKKAIGGLAREFYRRLGRHYGKDEAWTFEPHVAETIYRDWLEQEGIPVHFGKALHAVRRQSQNARLDEIEAEDGTVFAARVFLDASYEGDLLAKAGVSHHIGREANAVYGESYNGVHFGHPNHNFIAPVDPYRVPGKPDSGLLPGITEGFPGNQGDGDYRIQAYNFRMCLTDDPANLLPFPQPANYDPERYTLLARYLAQGVWDALRLSTPMPGRKTDTNNFGAFSTDFIGGNHAYPAATHAEREPIFQDHVTYQQGLMWFLGHDDRVPAAVRDEVARWGLPRDEFQETGGWPHQLYVREARRMVSAYVMTEHDCTGRRVADDPVGLAAYWMDSHHCQRAVVDGRVVNEGNVETPLDTPYPISYRSIVPREEECDNLLVPVCLAASHIAYGSIRMEPVFMVLGQSAATAADLALRGDLPVQRIDSGALRERLLRDGQVLAWS